MLKCLRLICLVAQGLQLSDFSHCVYENLIGHLKMKYKRVNKQNLVGPFLLICSRKSFRKPILPLLCSNFDAGDMHSQARQARARLLVTGVNDDLPANTAFAYCHNIDVVER